MHHFAQVLWDNVAPKRRQNFKVLLVGVAGQGGAPCELILLKALLDRGFVITEVGVCDAEQPAMGSWDGATEQAAESLRYYLNSFGCRPKISTYVGRLVDHAEALTMRTKVARIPPSRFQLSVYSSGDGNVVKDSSAIELASIIHAPRTGRPSVQLHFPFAVNGEGYSHQPTNKSWAWNWDGLLIAASESHGVVRVATDDGQGGGRGRSRGAKKRV